MRFSRQSKNDRFRDGIRWTCPQENRNSEIDPHESRCTNPAVKTRVQSFDIDANCGSIYLALRIKILSVIPDAHRLGDDAYQLRNQAVVFNLERPQSTYRRPKPASLFWC